MQRASAIDPRLPWLAAGLLLLASGGAGWYLSRPDPTGLPVVQAKPEVETAPMCPWREPETDLGVFFPVATGRRLETRILSGQRLELQQRLGRPPAPEEHSLHLYRILKDERLMGTILTRRVKGAFGGIEIVLAVDPNGRARGVRLQRLREPEAVAAALRSPRWLERFRGWTADETPGREELPLAIPLEGRPSGDAVAEGVRSLLVLYDVAQRGLAEPHH